MDKEKLLYGLIKHVADRENAKYASETAPVIRYADPIILRGADREKYIVGFGSEDIVPDNIDNHTYWMAGYNIGKKINGILDRPTVNAMWLGCGEKEGLLFLSCDLIGMTGADIRRLRRQLEPFCKKTGCRNITVSCTHTHAGIDTMGYWGPLPKTGKDAPYMRFLFEKIEEAVKNAYADRKEGKLFYGCIDAPELLDRWRQPYYSKALLHRLRFVPDDGSTETWYLNFPAHPNTLGGRNKLLSADYPCYMRREINRHKNVNVMYAISAIGATDIGKVSESDMERTILGGAKLGQKALEINDERQLKADVKLITRYFVMPIDNIVLSLAHSFGIFSARRCKADSQTGSGFISEISYLNFDGVQILTMPGEMFPELVWAGGYCDKETSATGEGAEIDPTPLSEIFNDDRLMIFGVTNDMAGYALAPNDFVLHDKMPFINRGTDRFGRNHYHETNSCGIKTGEIISEVCKEIRETLDGKR